MRQMRAVEVRKPRGPLTLVERAEDAYARVMSGEAQFRVVLKIA